MEIIQTVFIVLIFLMVAGRLFVTSYLKKKGGNLATKEDIEEITKRMEEVKNIYKSHYDISLAERDFYNSMVNAIQTFLSTMKRDEMEKGTEGLTTHKSLMKNEKLLKEYLDFADSANIILAQAYIFLDDKKWKQLHGAIQGRNNFADIRYNLLDAMRQSIYPETELESRNHTVDIKYPVKS